jgi:hypothetical protein
MFGELSTITELQGGHEFLAGIPVNGGDGSGRKATKVESVIHGPVVEDVMVFQERTNNVGACTAQLAVGVTQ